MRSNKRATRLWSLLAFILAGVLLYFSFRGTRISELVEILGGVNKLFLILTGFVVGFSYFVRGLRWRLLLSTEKSIPILTVFWANMIGYLGNIILPARAGELLRSLVIGQNASISGSFALGTGISERMLDALVLVLIGTISTSFVSDLPLWLLHTTQIMGVIALLGLLAMILMPRFPNFFTRVVSTTPLSERIKDRLVGLIRNFLLGLAAFQRPQQILRYSIYTSIIWFTDAFGAVIIANALGFPLGIMQALLFLAALGISSAVPSTPGYLGIYQFVSITILPIFNFSQQEALVYIILLQLINYALVVALGLTGLWRMEIGLSRLLSLRREQTL